MHFHDTIQDFLKSFYLYNLIGFEIYGQRKCIMFVDTLSRMHSKYDLFISRSI